MPSLGREVFFSGFRSLIFLLEVLSREEGAMILGISRAVEGCLRPESHSPARRQEVFEFSQSGFHLGSPWKSNATAKCGLH